MPNMCSTCPTVSYLGFRTPTQISGMSEADCANTLIVELAKLTSDSTQQVSQLSHDDLIAFSYGSNALWLFNLSTVSNLATLSLDDQRNRIISELASMFPYTLSNISESQSWSTRQLVNVLLSVTLPHSAHDDVETLQSILGDLVNINGSHIRFGARDSVGQSMDALHVIQIG